MNFWLELAWEIFRRIFSLDFAFYFLFAVALVAFLYRKMNKTKKQLFGVDGGAGEKVWVEVIKATGWGLFGGLIGSFLMVLAGVTLNNIGISYLWLLAILLFMLNPRYLCFAYAGGLLSLSHLIFGFPSVEVPQLMGLVAILHLVESLLILWSGHLGALPVYVSHNQGRVVGGFNLQRFWPIPLVVMFVVPIPMGELIHDFISMPNWWPLIRSPLAENPNLLYTMLPVVAALGYGDLALTDTPAAKSRWSAGRLAAYSLILLFLSIAASYWGWVVWLAALFGPLGHELLILKGQQKELQGEPMYCPPEKGVMILDVRLDSPAYKLGLTSGDILINLNGFMLNTKWELAQVLTTQPDYLVVDYVRKDRAFRTQGRLPPGESIGIISVPEPSDRSQVQFNSQGLGARIWVRLRNKLKL